MTCTHNETDKDVTVVADGICPLCLVDEVATLKKELKVLQRAYNELYRERYGDSPVVYGHVGVSKSGNL